MLTIFFICIIVNIGVIFIDRETKKCIMEIERIREIIEEYRNESIP